MSYVVEGDALHGFVLLQGVHLVQVAVSDEHSPVLRLVETVDLGNTKLLISDTTGYSRCTQTRWHLHTLQGNVVSHQQLGLCLCTHRHVLWVCAHVVKSWISALKTFYLAYVAGEQDSHEFVFPLQIAWDQCERCCRVRAVSLLSDTHTTRNLSKYSSLTRINSQPARVKMSL